MAKNYLNQFEAIDRINYFAKNEVRFVFIIDFDAEKCIVPDGNPMVALDKIKRLKI